MSTFNDSGKFGQISNQSTVVVNGQHDLDDLKNRMNASNLTHYIYPAVAATVDPATSRIDINDIVFTVSDGKNSRRSILNNAIPVMSNCNGLAIEKTKRAKRPLANPNDEEEVIAALLESIRPIGQAIGASNPLPEREEQLKLNFTIRTQGTAHIMNTGTVTFCPGESVYIDLFRKNEIIDTSNKLTSTWNRQFSRFGFSNKKVPLKLVKMDAVSKNYEWALRTEMSRRSDPNDSNKRIVTAQGVFANAIINFMKDIHFIANKDREFNVQELVNNRDDDSEDVGMMEMFRKVMDGDVAIVDKEYYKNAILKKVFSDLFFGIRYMYNDLDRRRLGTCLSFAKPGKGMDINLSI